MDSDLYQILCENDLAEHQVIVALTSRKVYSVSDFLETGGDALKDMRDKYTMCSNSWSEIANCYSWHFPEYREDDFRDCKLVTVVQLCMLEYVLKTLRETKK